MRNYNLYKEAIEKIEGLTLLPFRSDTRANHWFYSVIVDKEKYGIDRDELMNRLNSSNIQTRPLWRLVHKQKPYLENDAYRIEKAYYYEKNLINVPCSSNLTEEEIEIVIENLERKNIKK